MLVRSSPTACGNSSHSAQVRGVEQSLHPPSPIHQGYAAAACIDSLQNTLGASLHSHTLAVANGLSRDGVGANEAQRVAHLLRLA